MDYTDLEIALRPRGDGQYLADLSFRTPESHAPAALATGIVLAFDQGALRQLHTNQVAYASALHTMLFAEELMRSAWQRAVGTSEGRRTPMRVRLLLADDDLLHAMRWETLYDGRGVFFARSQRLLFSRYLASDDVAVASASAAGCRRALVAVAAAGDLEEYGFASIDADAEIALAREALGDTLDLEILACGQGSAASLQNMLARLRAGPRYDVLYLVCHGERKKGSLLVLEDEEGCVDTVSGARFAAGLRQLDPDQLPRLIFLAACHSAGESHRPETLAALAPELARAGILAILAMQGLAPMAMVRQMMATFFRELLRDGQVDRALNAARLAVDDDLPWWMPVLYMRLSSGQLWQVPQATPLLSDDAPPARTRRPAQIFISYKRNVEHDEMLARQLYAELAAVGHTPFFDQLIPVGARWRDELERQIAASDFLIVLLSEASVTSQAIAQELELSAREQRRSGKARVLPVRVAYQAALPYQLRPYLHELQYVTWDSPADTQLLIARLLTTIEQRQDLPAQSVRPFALADVAQPQPFADPRPVIDEDFIVTLADPSGVVKRSDPFYIERASDLMLRRALMKRDGRTITIRAGRQTGKTSLLMRAMQQLKEAGTTCVFVDLQAVDDTTLASGESFLRYLALRVVKELHLDIGAIDTFWRQEMFTVQDRMNDLLNDYVLAESRGSIALCIDEADRLLQRTYADNFFGLLRSWHNRRDLEPDWERLDLLLVISTEPSLLIKDTTQSPFNVGTRLKLTDFDTQQVAELNQRYRAPLSDAQIGELYDFLGGHPYLTRRALYTLVTGIATWDQLIADGIQPDSPFHDHLKYYYLLVSGDNDLRDDLRTILLHGECADDAAYNRLFSAGLLRSGDRHHCTFRARLYEEFFRDKLDELMR